jgi:hypothetical protein
MDEESRFWIIPIICFISVAVIMAFAADYKINTVFPNAIIEKEELENMSCSEILLKDAENNYWSKENAQIGKAKALGCNPAKESQSTGLSPYVEFCKPGGFAPVKKIGNSTHLFNHDTCVWDKK